MTGSRRGAIASPRSWLDLERPARLDHETVPDEAEDDESAADEQAGGDPLPRGRLAHRGADERTQTARARARARILIGLGADEQRSRGERRNERNEPLRGVE